MIRSVMNKMTPFNRSLFGVHNRGFAAAQCQLKSLDSLPGSFDLAPDSEVIREWTDAVMFYDEALQTAKQHDAASPMYKMNLRGIPSVALLDHNLVKQWNQYELQGQAQRFFPPIFSQAFGRPFGDMAGKEHSQWKKKAMPAFKPKMLDELTPFIQESAQKLVLERIYEASQRGESIPFCQVAKRFVFEIASKYIFGPLLDDSEREHVFEMFQRWAQGQSPIAIGQCMNDPNNPDTMWADCLRAKAELNEYLADPYREAEHLTATNNWENAYGDNAQCLLRSLMENDAIFQREDYTLIDKMDFVLVISLAAYDTTATAMTNMLYSMWQNPEATEKVRDAILAHPELSDCDAVYNFDILKSCNEMECFINESLRAHHFVPALLPRIVHDENGVDIGGYQFPKGTGLIIPLQFLQSGEGSWTDANAFNPSRFDKANGRSKMDRGDIGRYNHIPFATGIHKCLGMHLAMLELRVYTTLILRDWEFELDEERLEEEGTINHLNLSQSFAHYNVYLKLRKRQN